MIISAYITPHSPILIPNIGKQNSTVLEKTSESFNVIKKELLTQNLDTIIIISPHKKNNPDISLNNHFDILVNFEELGDYLSKINLEGDMSLAYKIKESLEPDFFLNLEADKKAEYGANIPLYLLLSENNQKLKDFKGKVLIINTSLEKDLSHHFEIGQKMYTELQKSEKRIALIASGELSHCLSRNAPGGFFQKANLFDDKTIENLKKGRDGMENILNGDPKLALEAKECGLRPIALMLGIISELQFSPETLSYQKDLGVGYLSMKMGVKENKS